MRFLIVSFCFVGAGVVSAAPFADYRAKISGAPRVAELRKLASERILQLRTLMGTQATSLVDLSTPPFKELVQGKLSNARKKTRAGVIKRLVQDSAERLRGSELEGSVAVFDPSDFDSEIDQKRAARRLAFCDKDLAGQYETLVREMAHEFLTKSASSTVAMAPAVVQLESKLVQKFQSIVSQGIQAKLGKVSRVEFSDGRVMKLVFRQADGRELPASFSMLSTYRTVRDRYFLLTLECVRRHIETNSAPDSKTDADYRSLTQFLLPKFTEYLQSAGKIHNLLATLSRSELGELLDLFLVLSDGDLPTSIEFSVPDDVKTWKAGTNPPSFPAWVFRATAEDMAAEESALKQQKALLKKRDTKAAQLAAAQATAARARLDVPLSDYQYYHLMHKQMDQLQEWLEEEAQREAREQKRMDDMGDESP